MRLLEAIEALRKCVPAQVADIARATGLPYHTLRKIASGETRDPRVSTVAVLARYFDLDGHMPMCHDEQEAA